MPPCQWAWVLLINEGFFSSNKKGKDAPPKGGNGKGKAPRGERSEHNSDSDGESFDSQGGLFESEDKQPYEIGEKKLV